MDVKFWTWMWIRIRGVATAVSVGSKVLLIPDTSVVRYTTDTDIFMSNIMPVPITVTDMKLFRAVR